METPFHRLDTHHRLDTQINLAPIPLIRQTSSLPVQNLTSNLKPIVIAKSKSLAVDKVEEDEDSYDSEEDRQYLKSTEEQLVSNFNQIDMPPAQLSIYQDSLQKLRMDLDREKTQVLEHRDKLRQLENKLALLDLEGDLEDTLADNIGIGYMYQQSKDDLDDKIKNLESENQAYKHVLKRVRKSMIFHNEKSIVMKRVQGKMDRRLAVLTETTKQSEVEYNAALAQNKHAKEVLWGLQTEYVQTIKQQNEQATKIRKELDVQIGCYMHKKKTKEDYENKINDLKLLAERRTSDKSITSVRRMTGYMAYEKVEREIQTMITTFQSYQTDEILEKWNKSMSICEVLDLEADHLGVLKSKKELKLSALTKQYVLNTFGMYQGYHKIKARRNNADIYFKDEIAQRRSSILQQVMMLQLIKSTDQTCISVIAGLLHLYKSVCNTDILTMMGPPESFSLLMDAIEKQQCSVNVNFDEMKKMIWVLTASLVHLNVVTAQRNDYMTKSNDLDRVVRVIAQHRSTRIQNAVSKATRALANKKRLATFTKHFTLPKNEFDPAAPAVRLAEDLLAKYTEIDAMMSTEESDSPQKKRKAIKDKQQSWYLEPLVTNSHMEAEDEHVGIQTERARVRRISFVEPNIQKQSPPRTFVRHMKNAKSQNALKYEHQATKEIKSFDKKFQTLNAKTINLQKGQRFHSNLQNVLHAKQRKLSKYKDKTYDSAKELKTRSSLWGRIPTTYTPSRSLANIKTKLLPTLRSDSSPFKTPKPERPSNRFWK